jgi:hypothetical protein
VLVESRDGEFGRVLHTVGEPFVGWREAPERENVVEVNFVTIDYLIQRPYPAWIQNLDSDHATLFVKINQRSRVDLFAADRLYAVLEIDVEGITSGRGVTTGARTGTGCSAT